MSNRTVIKSARSEIASAHERLSRIEELVSSREASIRLGRAKSYMLVAILELDRAADCPVDPILDLTCGARQ